MGNIISDQKKKIEHSIPPGPSPSSTSSKIKQLEQEIIDWKNKYQLILEEKENLQTEHNKLLDEYNNIKVDFELLTKEKERYKELYYEQGSLNITSFIYVIFTFLIVIFFIIWISIKGYQELRGKPPKSKELQDNLVSKA